jgi:hypothetical protein
MSHAKLASCWEHVSLFIVRFVGIFFTLYECSILPAKSYGSVEIDTISLYNLFCLSGSELTKYVYCLRTYLDCTFLGPSRKRGPPKGYIDAIEARLHQTEALVGIILAANDSRARSLLDDISQVTLTTNPPNSESTSASASI